jgi:hypothetical protein
MGSGVNTGILGSSPAQGMDVCRRLSVLCCSVDVDALRRADPPPRGVLEVILN